MSEQSSKVQQDGMRWFVGALIVAIAFSLWLKHVDDLLMNSTRERDLGATLRELRGAQTGIPSGVSDSRQTFEPLIHQGVIAEHDGAHEEAQSEPHH